MGHLTELNTDFDDPAVLETIVILKTSASPYNFIIIFIFINESYKNKIFPL